MLRAAIELGVQVIDTADAYGPDVNELLIAEALHPYPADLVIATKGGCIREGPWQLRPDGRPEHLRAACEASLQRLRLEQVALYQLHMFDPDVPLEESVGALAELRSEGKIRHIGLSNVSVSQLEKAREIAAIASVQNRYNLAERASTDVLSYCEREGLVFIPWFPLGKGTLARSRELKAIGARSSSTPAQTALAWLLHSSSATLPIPGTTSRRHLADNVAATAVELTAEDLRELESLRPSGTATRTRIRHLARRVLGPIALPLLRRIAR